MYTIRTEKNLKIERTKNQWLPCSKPRFFCYVFVVAVVVVVVVVVDDDDVTNAIASTTAIAVMLNSSNLNSYK